MTKPLPPHLQTGRDGEDAACAFLRGKGYAVVERNVRVGKGELDVVARHRGQTVFVEVKTRGRRDYGAPAEMVTPGKARRMLSAARAYAAERGRSGESFRFDVVGVMRNADGTFGCELFADVLDVRDG